MYYIPTGFIKNSRSIGGSYSGEKDMGTLDNWHVLSADSNDILESTYDILSARSMTLYHTYPPAKGAINKQNNYAIGPGLVYRSQPDFRTLGFSKEWAKDFSRDWQKIVDYYQHRFNLYEKQGVLFRSAMGGGDSFLWYEKSGGEIKDMIETQNVEVNGSYNHGDYTMGVKHDNFFRKTGVMKADGTPVPFRDGNGDQNFVQCYFKDLGRQLRGYPLIYMLINFSRNDDTHWDAITHRAVMESIMMASFEGKGTSLQTQMKGLAEANKKQKGGSTGSYWKNLFNVSRLGAGNIMTFNSGEKLTWGDMKTPSSNFGTFKDWGIIYVGMGTDTPPEFVTSKYTSTYTAHRGAANDFKHSYMRKRSGFINTVLNPTVLEIAKDAINQGFIKMPGFLTGGWMIQKAYLNGYYLGPVPGYINPFQEVVANERAVKAGFELRSKYVNLNGYEYESFISEWEEQQRQYSSVPSDVQDTAILDQEMENSILKGDDE